MKELKQNDKVKFDLNEKVVGLTGKICGKVGPVVIVELDKAMTGYEFTHIYILDTQVKE